MPRKAAAAPVAQAHKSATVSNPTQSVALMRNLIRTSLSTVVYLRNVFPEDLFKSQKMAGLEVRVLAPRNSESKALLDWIEAGVFEAVEKGYASEIVFGIYKDPEDPSTLLESYHFKIAYGDGGMSIRTGINGEGSAGTPQFSSDSFQTKQEIRSATVQMIRMLVLLTQTLAPLPERRCITLKVFYNDSAPPDYEPRGFRCSTHDDDLLFPSKPIKFSVGDIKTPYHQFNLELKTVLDAVEHAAGQAEDNTESTALQLPPPTASENNSQVHGRVQPVGGGGDGNDSDATTDGGPNTGPEDDSDDGGGSDVVVFNFSGRRGQSGGADSTSTSTGDRAASTTGAVGGRTPSPPGSRASPGPRSLAPEVSAAGRQQRPPRASDSGTDGGGGDAGSDAFSGVSGSPTQGLDTPSIMPARTAFHGSRRGGSSGGTAGGGDGGGGGGAAEDVDMTDAELDPETVRVRQEAMELFDRAVVYVLQHDSITARGMSGELGINRMSARELTNKLEEKGVLRKHQKGADVIHNKHTQALLETILTRTKSSNHAYMTASSQTAGAGSGDGGGDGGADGGRGGVDRQQSNIPAILSRKRQAAGPPDADDLTEDGDENNNAGGGYSSSERSPKFRKGNSGNRISSVVEEATGANDTEGRTGKGRDKRGKDKQKKKKKKKDKRKKDRSESVAERRSRSHTAGAGGGDEEHGGRGGRGGSGSPPDELESQLPTWTQCSQDSMAPSGLRNHRLGRKSSIVDEPLVFIPSSEVVESQAKTELALQRLNRRLQ